MPRRVEPPELLGERAVDREVAGLQPRHVMAGRMRRHELRLDLVERQRRGVDDARARRAMSEQGARHDRAGIEADRATRHEVAAAERDEVRSARPGADEMHRHRASSGFGQRAGDRPDRQYVAESSLARRTTRREGRGFGDRRHAGERLYAAGMRIASGRPLLRARRARTSTTAQAPCRRCRDDARLAAFSVGAWR